MLDRYTLCVANESMCIVVLVLITLGHLASAERFGDDKRLVYRAPCALHNHAGNDSAVDDIGCAEHSVELLEHALTPSMLWCNETACVGRGNISYEVHSINCSSAQCLVQVHCVSRVDDAKLAGGITLGALLGLLVSLVVRQRARTPPTMHYADKLL